MFKFTPLKADSGMYTDKRTEIADLVVARDDPVRADRDNDISVTCENVGEIIVSPVARYRLAPLLCAWPLEKSRAGRSMDF